MIRRNILVTLTMGLALVATETYAQNLWGGDTYGGYGHGYGFEMAVIRIVSMLVPIGAGFCLGWFVSPQAKGVAQACFHLCLHSGLHDRFNNGALGWGERIINLICGFLCCDWFLGWKKHQTPWLSAHQFWSSRWEKSSDLAKHKLLGTTRIRLGTAFNGEIDQTIS